MGDFEAVACHVPQFLLSPLTLPVSYLVSDYYGAVLVGNGIFLLCVIVFQVAATIVVKCVSKQGWLKAMGLVRAPSLSIAIGIELYASTAPAIIRFAVPDMGVCRRSASCTAIAIVCGLVVFVPVVAVVIVTELLVRIGGVSVRTIRTHAALPFVQRMLSEASGVRPLLIAQTAGALVGRDRKSILGTVASNAHMWPGMAMAIVALMTPWSGCNDQYWVGGCVCVVCAVLYVLVRPFCRVVDWAAHCIVMCAAGVCLIVAAVVGSSSAKNALSVTAMLLLLLHTCVRIVLVLVVYAHQVLQDVEQWGLKSFQFSHSGLFATRATAPRCDHVDDAPQASASAEPHDALGDLVPRKKRTTHESEVVE